MLLDDPPIGGTVRTVTDYELLGLAPGANTADVKKAWRSAARRWHPDSGTEPDVDVFIRARQAYGRLLAEAAEPAPVRQEPRPIRPVTAGLPPHNPFLHQPGPARPGVDLTVLLALTPAEAASGGSAEVPLDYSVVCPSCLGAPGACQLCSGTGWVPHRAATTVTWRPGVVAGERWREPRAGGPGVGGGAPGDVFVTVQLAR